MDAQQRMASMIWHLYDYYLDAGAGYFGTKKACEPLHIQYSYDDLSVVVVNSTYEPVARLHASIHVHNLAWKELYNSETTLNAGADSAQRVFSIPESLYTGADKIFFIDFDLIGCFRPRTKQQFLLGARHTHHLRLGQDRLYAHAGGTPRGPDRAREFASS